MTHKQYGVMNRLYRSLIDAYEVSLECDRQKVPSATEELNRAVSLMQKILGVEIDSHRKTNE